MDLLNVEQSIRKIFLSSVDNSSRVGDIPSSTCVSSSDSRDGSRGSSEGGERGRGGNTRVAGSSVGKRIASIARIASIGGIAGVAKAVVAEQVGVCLSTDCCSKHQKGRLEGCVLDCSAKMHISEMEDMMI